MNYNFNIPDLLSLYFFLRVFHFPNPLRPSFPKRPSRSGINFTYILQPAFCANILLPKNYKAKYCNQIKAVQNTFKWKKPLLYNVGVNKLTLGVNFINILCMPCLLYDSVLLSFSLITVLLCNFLQNNIIQ